MKYRVLFGITTLVFVAGCGGSRIDSGVDGAKTGGELTEDETQDVCVAVLEYADESASVDDRCAIDGLTAAFTAFATSLGAAPDSELQAACAAAVDECADDVDDDQDFEFTCGFVDSLGTCTSTVDEIETCYADLIDATLKTVRDLPTCAEITGELLLDLAEDPPDTTPEVDSCSTVAQSCPDGYALSGSLGAFL